MTEVPGPFKASKDADNRQRKNLPKQALKPKGQNAAEVERITRFEEIMSRTSDLLKSMGKTVDNYNLVKPVKKRPREEVVQSGKGYVYIYDDDGKPILKGRYLLEKALGRPLKANEVVTYKDGNRRNCELVNIELGIKNLTPFSKVKCTHCGSVGEIEIIP